jgi:hypothetical protein
VTSHNLNLENRRKLWVMKGRNEFERARREFAIQNDSPISGDYENAIKLDRLKILSEIQ